MSRKELECLGSQRPSLSTNPLLIAPLLGRTRRRCFTLPPADFTYGMKTICFDGGVAEALTIWRSNHKRKDQEKIPDKDFIVLNKLAAKSGLTTAQEQSHFRACNDIRRRDKEKEEALKSNYPPDIVFGIATRPSTPINELLANRYQEKWLIERREAERKEREKLRQRNLQGKIFETNASLLRRYSEPVDARPYWKMKRFDNIPATLNTFASDKERERAFAYFKSESVAREGMLGQGIYTT